MKAKLQTINGEKLRSEFTAFEAAALQHAALYCADGDQFVGVPTSNEERYRNSKETFAVIEHDGKRVSIYRHATNKTITAIIVDDSTPKKAKPGMGQEEFEGVDKNERVDFEGELPKDEATEVEGDEDDFPMPEPNDEPKSEEEPKFEDTPKSEDEQDEQKEDESKADEQEQEATPVQAPNPLDPYSMLVNQVTQSVINQVKPMLDEVAKNQPKTASESVIKININDLKTEVKSLTHPKFERILNYVAHHKNVYLYGPAGSGKNVICEQVAQALGVPFYYQNTILTKFDVTGYKNAAGEFEDTEFYKAWTGGGVFMLDEADNASAEALVTLNAALANGYYTFPGIGRVECSDKFYCVAAGNTNGQGATDEYCGRYKMDESSRDRFFFVKIGYSRKIQEAIAGDHKDVLEFVRDLRLTCKMQRISLICGYRAVQNLVEFYDRNPVHILEDGLLKGMESDTIREIANRLEGENKYVAAFKQIATNIDALDTDEED